MTHISAHPQRVGSGFKATKTATACLTLIAAILPAPVSALETKWLGGFGSWLDAAQWSLGEPGPADVARIEGGGPSLAANRTIAGLRFLGGDLTGAGTLRITGLAGPSEWSGGRQTGSGATFYGGSLLITGDDSKGIQRVINAGNTTWSGNTVAGGNTLSFNGGTFNNTGTFVDANAFDAYMSNSAGTFNNSGSYNKQTNTVTSVGAATFNNTGNVNVNAGRLQLSAGGTSSGTFSIARGATVEFSYNGTQTLNAVTTTGAGTLLISGGYVNLNGGTHDTAFVLQGGVLQGATHTINGAAVWSGGSTSRNTLTDATNFAGTLLITGDDSKGTERVINAGNTTWRGNTGAGGNTLSFNGGTFNNTGTFVDANAFDAAMSYSFGAFNNSGTYNKQTNTVTRVAAPSFNNTGTVNVNAGTLQLAAAGTSSGTFSIAKGATLEIANSNSTQTFNAVTTTGAGTLLISGGYVNLNGGTHDTAFVLQGGVLQGATHTINGAAVWSGGSTSRNTLTDATNFAGTLLITGDDSKGTERVINAGNTTWRGNTGAGGNTLSFNGGTFNNTGTFVDANAFDAAMSFSFGAFNNSGTYNKQTNTLTSISAPTFNNTGTVNVNVGTLRIAQALTNRGVINTAAGARFEETESSFVNGGAGSLIGNGTVAVRTGGTIVNQGLISAGNSIGHLTLDGSLQQSRSGTLKFELASRTSFDTLTVLGSATLDGTLLISSLGYAPVLGDTFAVMSFAGLLNASRFNEITLDGYGSNVRFEALYAADGVSLRVSAVPEVPTYVLMLFGVITIGRVLRQRQRS